MSLRYLSVCSGIEAASVAFHPLGWSPVAFAEIEPFPCAVLAHHYGSNLPGEPLATNGVPNLGDITRFQTWPDLSIDLLVGGTPCQSFSVAGLRKGLADPRGNLALTYLAIADRYRPRWIIWENVPGVLSSGEGRDFGAFLGGLGQLGYGFAYRVLDAQYVRVDGFGRAVPQRRRRVFVVGYLGDWRRAAAVLFDAASLHGDPAPSRKSGEGLTPILASGAHGSNGAGIGRDGDVAFTLDTDGAMAVARSLNAHPSRSDGESETFVACLNGISEYHANLPTLRAKGGDAAGGSEALIGIESPIHFQGRGSNIDIGQEVAGTLSLNSDRASGGAPCIAFSCKDHGADAGEIAPTLRSMGHDGSHANAGGQLAVAFQSSQSGVREGGAHATLDANMGSRRHNGAVTPSGVRRLTPLECERLQAFPDGYTAVPFRGKPASDGPRYKALGNSKAVNCPRWIARRIEAVEALP